MSDPTPPLYTLTLARADGTIVARWTLEGPVAGNTLLGPCDPRATEIPDDRILAYAMAYDELRDAAETTGISTDGI